MKKFIDEIRENIRRRLKKIFDRFDIDEIKDQDQIIDRIKSSFENDEKEEILIDREIIRIERDDHEKEIRSLRIYLDQEIKSQKRSRDQLKNEIDSLKDHHEKDHHEKEIFLSDSIRSEEIEKIIRERDILFIDLLSIREEISQIKDLDSDQEMIRRSFMISSYIDDQIRDLKRDQRRNRSRIDSDISDEIEEIRIDHEKDSIDLKRENELSLEERNDLESEIEYQREEKEKEERSLQNDIDEIKSDREKIIEERDDLISDRENRSILFDLELKKKDKKIQDLSSLLSDISEEIEFNLESEDKKIEKDSLSFMREKIEKDLKRIEENKFRSDSIERLKREIEEREIEKNQIIEERDNLNSQIEIMIDHDLSESREREIEFLKKENEDQRSEIERRDQIDNLSSDEMKKENEEFKMRIKILDQEIKDRIEIEIHLRDQIESLRSQIEINDRDIKEREESEKEKDDINDSLREKILKIEKRFKEIEE